MATTAELLVRISGDSKGAVSALNQVGGAASRLGSPLGGLGSILGNIGTIAAGVLGGNLLTNGLQAFTGSVASAITGSIGLNDALESNAIGFETMLGSGEAAQAFLNQLQAFAAETPFTFVDLASASKRMLAFGFSAQQVIPLMTDIGNAAAGLGLGKAGIDRITLALGQMTAKGRVQGDELLQLQEAGISTSSIFDLMSKSSGKTVGELQKLQAAGKLDPALFIAAFQQFSKIRFADMMAKQATTRAGIWENVFETKDIAAGAIFKPVFQMLKDLGSAILDFTKTPAFAAWVGRLQGWVGTVTTILGAFASTWANVMKAHGLGLLEGGLVALELIIGSVFGAKAANLFHQFIDFLRQIPAFVSGILIPTLGQLWSWVGTKLPAAWALFSAAIATLRAQGASVLAFIAAFRGVLAIAGIISVVAGLLAFLLSPVGLIAVAIGLLAAAWVSNWGGIRDILAGVWSVLQPILIRLGALLWTNVTTAVAAASFFTGTIVPAFQAFASMLGTVVAGALTALSLLWTDTLLPALQAVWAFISGTLMPLFDALFNVLGAVVGVALETVAAILTSTFQPAWESVQTIVSTVSGLFSSTGDALSGPLQGGLQAVASFLSDTLLPLFQQLWSWLAEKLEPILGTIGTIMQGLPGKIPGAIAGVTGQLNRTAAGITATGPNVARAGAFIANQQNGPLFGTVNVMNRADADYLVTYLDAREETANQAPADMPGT